jgi:lysophospholipase L1-like esterase
MGIAQQLRIWGKATDRILQKLLPPEPGMEELAAAVGYVENAGSPYNSVTPDFIGQKLFDTTNSVWYQAYGITSTTWRPAMQGALDDSGNIVGLAGADGAISLVKPANLVGCLGDSITSQNNNGSATTNTLVPTIVSGGTGYAVNDGILLPSGVIVYVSSVSSGVVTAVILTNAGTAPFTAQASAAQVATTGSGTGFTCSLAAKGTGGLRYQLAQGYAAWAQAYSAGRTLFPLSLNWGFPGQGTTELLTMLPYFMAAMESAGAKTVVVPIGTNDVVAKARSYATTIANLESIYAQLVGAGHRVIVVPILPRAYDGSGDTGLSTSNVRAILRINQWIRRYCRDNIGMYLADPTLNWVDLTSATGYPIPATVKSSASYTNNSNSWTYDGLHPTPAGAQWVGKAISTHLIDLYPVADTRLQSTADLYDATDNPTGNLLANGLFNTASGGTAGTGASGTVVGSFTVNRYVGSNGTVVASVTTENNDNGTTYNAQTLALDTTVSGTTETWRMFQQIFSNYAEGDEVYGECEITVTSPPSAAVAVLTLQVDDGITTAKVMSETTDQVFSAVGWSGVLRTPSFKVGPAAAALTWRVNMGMIGASKTMTVKIARCALRKV